MGYHRAGFEVVGVDLVRQWAYPFEFHLGDALTWPLDGFDAIHASPPCKRFTVLRKLSAARDATLFDPHPDCLAPTLVRLAAQARPYVVENVVGAPMPAPIIECGSMYGLRVRRHRLFSSNVALEQLPCAHEKQGQVVGVYGKGGGWTRLAPGGGGQKVYGADAGDALGMTWTDDMGVLSQAIPPAYTEHVGRQLLAHLEEAA